MFSVGNQVIVKPENKQGFIYSSISDTNYVVGVEENGILKVKIFPEHQLELKPCKFGTDGKCDYVTTIATKGQFACMDCELKHDLLK